MHAAQEEEEPAAEGRVYCKDSSVLPLHLPKAAGCELCALKISAATANDSSCINDVPSRQNFSFETMVRLDRKLQRVFRVGIET